MDSALKEIEYRTAMLTEAYPYLAGLDLKWCRKVDLSNEMASYDHMPSDIRVSDLYIKFPSLFDHIFEKEYVVNSPLRDRFLAYVDRFVCKISCVTAVDVELSGQKIGLMHLVWISIPNTEFHYAIIPQKMVVKELEMLAVKCFEPFNIDLRPAGVCVHPRFLFYVQKEIDLLPSQANMVKHKLERS